MGVDYVEIEAVTAVVRHSPGILPTTDPSARSEDETVGTEETARPVVLGLEEATAAQNPPATPGPPVEAAPETDAAVEFYLASLQCLLFAAGRPVLAEEAARALQVESAEAENLLALLQERLDSGGLQVVRVARGYQMTTRPEHARILARFLEPPPQRLSQPALETLALIAYRQPLTLPEIEAVRGVKSDSSVRTLVERGLIEDSGRKEVVGRPILYRTTDAFLLYLGIESLAALPPLEAGSIADIEMARAEVGRDDGAAAGTAAAAR